MKTDHNRRAAWAHVPPQEQRRAALRVRDRLRSQLHRSPNVVSVGIGIRYTGGQRTEAYCVTVLVRKKWKTTRSRPGMLPRSAIATATVFQRKRRVEVPIDVVELVIPRAGSTGGTRCTSRLAQITDSGTACCLVYRGDDTTTPYVLGCHHVVYLTQRRRDPTPAEVPAFQLAINGAMLGPPVDPQPLRIVNAAIVPYPGAVPGDEMVDSNGAIALQGWADEPTDMPKYCRILTRRGVMHALCDYLAPQPIGGYHGNNTVYMYPEILKCTVLDNTPMPGDSGSPVIDEFDRLIGMHIAGIGKSSYAVPAYEFLTRLPVQATPVLQL